MTEMDKRIESVRRFNRFYTQKIGVLQEGLLKSPFTLTQLRVLYELAYRQKLKAADLSSDLNLDAGYLSRILADFEKRGLIERKQSADDARQSEITLTKKGTDAFAPLNVRSHDEMEEMLSGLSPSQQNRLLQSMESIQSLLNTKNDEKVSYILRPHQPGDMGWVIYRHGVLYSQEYGWDEQFEALVASICVKFLQKFDPKRERCWIAEKDGDIVGSVFLVKHSKNIAQLRMLYVEPFTRGLGIGRRLVDECIRFSRQIGYKKIILWTQSNLSAARHIYEATGFKIIKKEPHHIFGHDLVSEIWELLL
ncbi:MAG TPA: bifunctional helix-turn-helix transcriptional regulator/GNAT family N-acetyltransferase [Acidobacteriota bacterium]